MTTAPDHPRGESTGEDVVPSGDSGDPSHGSAADGTPYLPPAQPPPVPTSEPVPFDAKAMVSSARHPVANPSYGSLPTATPESRAAAEELRGRARRKRRRNRLLGWFVALASFAGVVAAGVLAYREYQADQDRQADERAAAQESGDGDDQAALTPLGEQQEIIEGLDALNDTARPSAGGFLDAVDQARDAVADINERNASAVPDPRSEPAAPPAPSPGLGSDYEVTEYVVRRFETDQAGAASVTRGVTYDHTTDTYWATVHRSADPGPSLVIVDAQWRTSVDPAGSMERVPRSALSREPSADSPLAPILSEAEVLPDSARPFAELIDTAPVDSPSGRLGVASSTFLVDVTAWQRADPQAHRAWLASWNGAGIDSPALVEAAPRQVRLEPIDVGALGSVADLDLPEPGTEPSFANRATVLFTRADDGTIESVRIVDPVDGVRVMYELLTVDQGDRLDLAFDDWIDAP